MKFYNPFTAIIIHCLFPICIGCSIYTFFRKKSILLFDWYEYMGIIDLILDARQFVNRQEIIYSNFITQSLPDGLWVYAFTYALLMIWRESSNSTLYSIIPLIIALTSEFGQYFNVLSGTFDLIDVITYIAFSLIPIITFKNSIYDK